MSIAGEKNVQSSSAFFLMISKYCLAASAPGFISAGNSGVSINCRFSAMYKLPAPPTTINLFTPDSPTAFSMLFAPFKKSSKILGFVQPGLKVLITASFPFRTCANSEVL